MSYLSLRERITVHRQKEPRPFGNIKVYIVQSAGIESGQVVRNTSRLQVKMLGLDVGQYQQDYTVIASAYSRFNYVHELFDILSPVLFFVNSEQK
jgi:hypothetical protein